MHTLSNLLGWLRFRFLLLLLFLCHDVAANTEIIRFSSSRRTADPRLDVLVGNWPTLHPSDNGRRWTLEPAALHTPLHQVCERVRNGSEPACPHELWVRLDLDDEPWASYATFTLRLSWPASAPADFAIALYAQQDLLALVRPPAERFPPALADTPRPEHAHARTHAATTRTRYARIRAVNAGVPTLGLPGGLPPRADGTVAPGDADRDRDRHRDGGRGDGVAVPFVLVLEPAYLGVLPASLLPTVGVLVLVLSVAVGLVVPWVMASVEPFARQAREDLNAGMTCSLRKER